ncbi:MAG: acetyl-coenzyme A synthetase N-terminal domain-containing protein, partial [Pseudomonadota bacterium]
MSYDTVYSAWRRDPVGFWAQAGAGIDWFTPASAVFDAHDGFYGRWFAGATCNTCYNCVDRHVEAGYGDDLALIPDSPVTDSLRRYSFAELQREVSALAYVLRDMGVEKG